MKVFLKYALRWQASGVIYAPLYPLLMGLNVSSILTAIICNFLGACAFFYVDKLLIFKKGDIDGKR